MGGTLSNYVHVSKRILWYKNISRHIGSGLIEFQSLVGCQQGVNIKEAGNCVPQTKQLWGTF